MPRIIRWENLPNRDNVNDIYTYSTTLGHIEQSVYAIVNLISVRNFDYF